MSIDRNDYRYPVRGVFRFRPANLRDAVLLVLANSSPNERKQLRRGLVGVVRQWQREQPEQFAELAALVMNAPRKTVIQIDTEAA